MVVVWYIADDKAFERVDAVPLRFVAVVLAVSALIWTSASIYNIAVGEAADSSPLGHRLSRGHRGG